MNSKDTILQAQDTALCFPSPLGTFLQSQFIRQCVYRFHKQHLHTRGTYYVAVTNRCGKLCMCVLIHTLYFIVVSWLAKFGMSIRTPD